MEKKCLSKYKEKKRKADGRQIDRHKMAGSLEAQRNCGKKA